MLTFTSTGDGSSAVQPFEWASGGGRTVNVQATGTFGSGTFKLQARNPGSSAFTDVPGAEFTEAGSVPVWITRGADLKLVTTGSTAPEVEVTVD